MPSPTSLSSPTTLLSSPLYQPHLHQPHPPSLTTTLQLSTPNSLKKIQILTPPVSSSVNHPFTPSHLKPPQHSKKQQISLASKKKPIHHQTLRLEIKEKDTPAYKCLEQPPSAKNGRQAIPDPLLPLSSPHIHIQQGERPEKRYQIFKTENTLFVESH